MGGNTTTIDPVWTPHWYVREITITRAETGFLASRFTLQIAFGQYTDTTDPITGATIFNTVGTRMITFTGADMMNYLNAYHQIDPNADPQAVLADLVAVDGVFTAAADRIVQILAAIGHMDLSAMLMQ